MSITSTIRYTRALDSTATDGSGKTGLAFGDITAKYLVQGGTLTSLTTETITTLGTYQAPTSSAHIRIKELAGADPTKGVYEIHFHNTQTAGSGKRLWLFLSATGAAFQPMEVDLIPYMDQDSQSAADLKDFVDTGYDPATHKVQGVVLTDTVTTYTGNTLQTGDSYARIGATGSGLTSLASAANLAIVAGYIDTEIGTIITTLGTAGAGLTALGDTRIAHLNADISSRMATYTQPTGFLSAIFPSGTIANTTNITAGTITTVTTVGTLTTYTGNTPQTGDSFARIGAAGAGLTALGDSRIGNLDAAVTTRMATYTQPTGFLSTTFPAGTVASSAEVTVIQNNTRVVRVVPSVLEKPDSGSTVFRVELLLYDTAGNMEAPDAAPTISVVNQGGTSRDSNLDSTTMSSISTGRYRSTYTVDTAHAIEQLIFAFSVVEGGATRIFANAGQVVDTTAVDFTSADRTKLDAMHAKLPSKAFLTGSANSDGDVQMDEATGNFPGTTGGMTAAGWAGAFLIDSGEDYSTAVAGSLVKEVSDNAGSVTLATLTQAVALALFQYDTGLLFADSVPGSVVRETANAHIPPSAEEIVDAIFNEPGVGYTGFFSTLALQATSIIIAGYIDTEIASILSAISGLNDISEAQVNAQVLDVMNIDTFAEPGQGAPGSTVSLVNKIGYIYKAWRNKATQTDALYSLYNDDTTTVGQKATVSSDGTTLTRAEMATGA